jgi:transposase
LRFILTPGQRHDITQAETLMHDITNSAVIADKGYDSQNFIEALEAKQCIPIIPPRSNRKNPRSYDEHIYKERHLIECFFGKIKHYRRLCSRFDKTAESFLAFLQFVSALLWLK